MKKNKTRLKIDQRGSALVFTVILLVNAVLISVAITTISIMEKKISSKTKSSAPAFQEADSGLEWALDKLAEGNSDMPITGDQDSTFWGFNITSTGEMSCPPAVGECSVYFIHLNAGSNEEVVTSVNSDTITAGEIIAVRSVGKKGDILKEQQVTRALEAHAAPNCPTNFISIGDFCVEADKSGGASPGARDWAYAADFCAVSRGGRLCTADELFLACEDRSANDIGDPQWTGSIVGSDSALYNTGSRCSDFAPDTIAVGTDKDFRCCRNR